MISNVVRVFLDWDGLYGGDEGRNSQPSKSDELVANAAKNHVELAADLELVRNSGVVLVLEGVLDGLAVLHARCFDVDPLERKVDHGVDVTAQSVLANLAQLVVRELARGHEYELIVGGLAKVLERFVQREVDAGRLPDKVLLEQLDGIQLAHLDLKK